MLSRWSSISKILVVVAVVGVVYFWAILWYSTIGNKCKASRAVVFRDRNVIGSCQKSNGRRSTAGFDCGRSVRPHKSSFAFPHSEFHKNISLWQYQSASEPSSTRPNTHTHTHIFSFSRDRVYFQPGLICIGKCDQCEWLLPQEIISERLVHVSIIRSFPIGLTIEEFGQSVWIWCRWRNVKGQQSKMIFNKPFRLLNDSCILVFDEKTQKWYPNHWKY